MARLILIRDTRRSTLAPAKQLLATISIQTDKRNILEHTLQIRGAEIVLWRTDIRANLMKKNVKTLNQVFFRIRTEDHSCYRKVTWQKSGRVVVKKYIPPFRLLIFCGFISFFEYVQCQVKILTGST